MKKLLNIILCIALPIMANAQELGQTLKGKVTDQATREPLIGATIVVEGADPAVSATTDEAGNFTLKELPVGRVTLQVSYIGYEKRSRKLC